MIKIVLNGVTLNSSDVGGENLTTVEVRDTNQSGDRVRAVSQQYTLTGAAYDLVAASFIDNPNGKFEVLPAQIYESGCCDNDVLLFEGRLISENVKWCTGVCEVEVVFEEYTDYTAQRDCLRSTLITDNWAGFKQNPNHPKFVYCVEIRPDLLFIMIMSTGLVLNNIFSVLTPIVWALSTINNVLQFIEDALDNIGIDLDLAIDFDGNSATSLLDEYNALRNRINQNIIGCGRRHASPLIKDYILNVCNKCGLQFSSTIFNDPASDYYHAAFFNAPIEKGSRDLDYLWTEKNAPIETGESFLNLIIPLWNARWEIINGTLYVERRDFFETGEIYVDYSILEQNNFVREKLCLEWRTDTRPSFAQYSFTQDAIDTVGNDALERYKTVAEWNQPFSNLQAGRKEVQFPFGAAGFRYDGTDFDRFGLFEIFDNNWFNGQIGAHKDVLLLEKHLTSLPKILIWDPNKSVSKARVKTYNNIPGNWTDFNGQNNYNYPMQFNTNFIVPNTAYPTNLPNSALYQRFHAIDNPKLTTDLGKSFTFSFEYNCTTLENAFEASHVLLPIGSSQSAVGRITNITVNLSNKTITIQGDV